MQNLTFEITRVNDAAIISSAGIEAEFNIDIETAKEFGEVPVEFYSNYQNKYLFHFTSKEELKAFLELSEEEIEKAIEQTFNDKLEKLSDLERVEYFKRADIESDVELMTQVQIADNNSREATELRDKIDDMYSTIKMFEAVERAHLEARDAAMVSIKNRLIVHGINTNRLVLKRGEYTVAYQLS